MSCIPKIDHPAYYKSRRFEAIDIIEDYGLNFNLGNAVKYILRAGKKDDTMIDLEKALWYIQREIDRLEKEGDPSYFKASRLFEEMDIIEDYRLNFSLGSALNSILTSSQYIDAVGELRKAKWCVEREVHRLDREYQEM